MVVVASVLGAVVGDAVGTHRAGTTVDGDPTLVFHCCGLHEVAVTHRHGLRVEAQSSQGELDYLALLSRLPAIGVNRFDVQVRNGPRPLLIAQSTHGTLKAWVAPFVLRRPASWRSTRSRGTAPPEQSTPRLARKPGARLTRGGAPFKDAGRFGGGPRESRASEIPDAAHLVTGH